MGCASSSDRESEATNARIDAELRAQRLQNRSQVKLLVLGAGESGKSTILKQMQLLHRGGFTPDERELYREILFSNTIQTMQAAIQSTKVLDLQILASNEANAFYIIDVDSDHRSAAMCPKIAAALIELWADPAIKETFAQKARFQINDSAEYLFDSVSRVFAPDFVASDPDILRARVRTTGIIESFFQIGKVGYHIFDVGGQRSERKKWIHCFEGVDVLLFVVAISEYDQKLYEDDVTTRMSESMILFESISNSRWFAQSSLVVFFNKCDLLAEKLFSTSVKLAFPEFTGDEHSFVDVSRFFQSTFFNLYTQSKPIYSHFTTAIDTTALEVVVDAVMDTINHNMMEELKCLM